MQDFPSLCRNGTGKGGRKMDNEGRIVYLLENILEKLDYIATTNMDIAVNASNIMGDVSTIKNEIEDRLD